MPSVCSNPDMLSDLDIIEYPCTTSFMGKDKLIQTYDNFSDRALLAINRGAEPGFFHHVAWFVFGNVGSIMLHVVGSRSACRRRESPHSMGVVPQSTLSTWLVAV